jgi:hypothetical protein
VSRTSVKLDGQSWMFDEDDITIQDAYMLKSVTGMGLRGFFEGLQDMDPQCLQALVWFLRRKAGEQVQMDEVNFKVTSLQMEQQPDPTNGNDEPT